MGIRALDEACSLLSEVNDSDFGMSVNASAVELMSSGYALRVLTILSKYNLQPSRLEIEITESVATDNEGKVASVIRDLRKAGVRFAVDDFGKGNSSFGQLLKLDVDRIKIDKMFVDQIDQGGGMPLIEAIVQMARHKGLKTTAEGIETADQRAALTALGCDHLQGFELSRPLTRDLTIELICRDEGQIQRLVP